MNTEAYDHYCTVTAFFDTRAVAEKAKADIVATGVSSNMVTLVEGHDGSTGARDPAGSLERHPEYDSTSGSTYDPARSLEQHPEGFWGSLKNLFAPEDDRHAYAEELSRGGFLVSVQTDQAHYERVIGILDNEGAVNMDERESKWRSEGWNGRHAGAPVEGASSAAAFEGTSRAATFGTAPAGRGGTIDTPDTAMARNSAPARDERLAASEAVGDRGRTAVGDQTVELAEETLRVGKRDVNHGRVRLRSYIVEKPVHESVTLHSENVDVTRRPVDRPLAAGENLFEERTISAQGHHEEAVVSKEAHVYEEVGLRKTAQDNVKEINETVRRTELEADDEQTGPVGGLGTGQERTLAAGAGAKITEHMDVLASDGEKIGTVDHMDGTDRIKLTKTASPDGMHHFIPLSWVERVDQHVHLSKAASAVRSEWN